MSTVCLGSDFHNRECKGLLFELLRGHWEASSSAATNG
jgi:hypothetical protein